MLDITKGRVYDVLVAAKVPAQTLKYVGALWGPTESASRVGEGGE
jgi:hypothetical protein